jgi:probable phosphoglycerate mutase
MIKQLRAQPGQTLLLTLRHGLTELNRDKRVGGHTDVPLIEEGLRQAEQARDNFQGTPFDVVVSSPLERAIQTAVIVTGVERREVQIEPLCIERFFGAMEGLTRPQVQERFPQILYLQIDHIGYSLNPPGGESFEALRRRTESFLQKVLGQHAGRRVVISSHQNFLQQLHGLLRGRDPFDCLRDDILNLELNQFLLGPQGILLDQRRDYLCPEVDRHGSF